ncbi:hypothetical protein KY290_014100 [Solanum tuberosum]|uniref:Uncharacterized protein n=1 Tax=Solanum tuberosum TaxID=4113 RepID=A0ABQ7VNQ8_SOLTU|nr:hypothetical protein KY284_003452 [Solanum tuberosum]KAH0732351.1 hypothetical protein KY289_003539 [Solanum tuberosum]KAH0767411.1 hypothetical protein KY285_003282 [Solanum tuberosum]KAH0770119.1 hypothetical protein KY290_014100 [Solanum tuberosum]
MAMEFETQTQLGFPFWSPTRRRFGPDDPFFAYGNIQRELLAKQVALDLTEEENQLVQNTITDEEIRIQDHVHNQSALPFLLRLRKYALMYFL